VNSLELIPKPLRSVILSREYGEESRVQILRFAQDDIAGELRDDFSVFCRIMYQHEKEFLAHLGRIIEEETSQGSVEQNSR